MQVSKKQNNKKDAAAAATQPAGKNRVLTGVAVAAVIIPAVLFLPVLGFVIAFAALALLAAWEWSDLAGLTNPKGRAGFVAALLATMASYQLWLGYLFDWFMWPVLAFWLVLAIAMRQAPNRLLQWRYPTAAKLALGYFVLLSAWVLFVWLRVNFGAAQVLYLLVLTSVADMAAYFVGKRWGQTKLLPEISPGKTVEGLYGAMGAVLVLALLVGGYFFGIAGSWSGMVFGDFILLSLMTVLISVAGDLFESLVKRLRGVKDSGTWLPGHGGVLDRIDSLLAAVPMFYIGCYVREIFFQ